MLSGTRVSPSSGNGRRVLVNMYEMASHLSTIETRVSIVLANIIHPSQVGTMQQLSTYTADCTQSYDVFRELPNTLYSGFMNLVQAMKVMSAEKTVLRLDPDASQKREGYNPRLP